MEITGPATLGRLTLPLEPHLPPSWPHVSLQQLAWRAGELRIPLATTAPDPATVELSPALPAGAGDISVAQDSAAVPFVSEPHGRDVHAGFRIALRRKTEVTLRYRGGVATAVVPGPPLEGESSRDLRVLWTTLEVRRLEMLIEALPDHACQVRLLTPWRVRGVDVLSAATGVTAVRLRAPSGAPTNAAGSAAWTARMEFE